ncbi:nucleotidyltransferase/DNA polymerase [Deinococcus peraridilitoris]|uniref:Nucleotidyltransferase/DNA polymerase involved in DNA repair n=1 Tax=Deinococcus peraridilitoris (strain DSM 19664 / LMG 22246 / CIP 109416 / KR-200) TaxID=937777 RepID=L0A3F9_DEIPD|nr:nucleotidyltransferase/DNA polymerase [Deinococcus peraridilitoris]AFZ68433.1 nucleotidyltransferase/DNA polymerase involved in DNA repair [Deinococcus peraridilitoris DSM 19664]
MIAALLLEPFALWHAERAHPGAPVIVTQAGKVRHVCALARQGGVEVGMTVHGALSRLPELATQPLSQPHLAAGWEALVEGLFAYSPRIEAVGQGRVLLTLTEAAGRELAAQYHARVGLAESRELALLAALSARAGEARVIAPAFETALQALPLEVLGGIGLSARKLADLHFLGLRRVEDLLKWSKSQQAGFLGAEYAALKPYLHGPRDDRVPLFQPRAELMVGLNFEFSIHEPGELGAALMTLAERLLPQLNGRQAGRLVLSALTMGGQLSAVREVKEPLSDARRLVRLARLALQDLGSEPFALGIDQLELRLVGVGRAARQPGLWPGIRELDATSRVLSRFPHALVRAEWFSARRYAFDQCFRWVDFVTGEPRTCSVKRPLDRKTFAGQSKVRPPASQTSLFSEWQGAGGD